MSELRIGDAERETAVQALAEHYASGRLSKDEYDERSDRAHAARTASDLGPLFADLPRSGPAGDERQGAAPGPTHGRGQGPGWGRPRRGPWWGGIVIPVLVALGVLVVVTHLFPLILVVVAVIFFAKVFGGGAGCGGHRQRWH